MLFKVLTAACLSLVPAFAQEREARWNLDIHRVPLSLSGTYRGTQNGEPVDFDIKKDLALTRDQTPLGFGLSYQGPRFGLEASLDTQRYAGTNLLQRDIVISGQTYQAMGTVETRMKMINISGLWTIRFLRAPGFWFGLDLGVRGTSMDLRAKGSTYLGAQSVDAVLKGGLPMPQIGPSVGYMGLGGRLVAHANYHVLAYSGARYHFTEGDIRYFPLTWLGLRAFAQAEAWNVPEGSLDKVQALTLDRSGGGIGVVAKF